MRIEKDALRQARERCAAWVRKNRIVVLLALLGCLLLLWPQKAKQTAPEGDVQADVSLQQTQAELEALLSRMDGVGKAAVMLTLRDSGETVYQQDESVRDGAVTKQTVLADKAPLTVRTRSPQYQGAVVVCEGADSAGVQLAVTQAVASLTGLGSDRITVIKMKGQ